MKKTYRIYSVLLFVLLPLAFPFSIFAQGSGNALEFDGDNYISVPSFNLGSDNSQFAIEMWVYARTTTSGTILHFGDGQSTDDIRIFLDASSDMNFIIREGSNTKQVKSFGANFPANTWVHVAVGCEFNVGLSQYIYGLLWNGSQEDTAMSPTINIQSLSRTYQFIGARIGSPTPGSPTDFFDGYIDEVRVWNIAKTQNEGRDYMCQKRSGSETGLSLYYRFDESTPTANDLTSNNYDGTLNNFTSGNITTSGAAIGDASVATYPPAGTISLSHSNGDAFSISTFTGSANGVHIYRVDSAPNVITPPSPYVKLDALRYLGVFFAGGTSPTCDISYDYTGHPYIVDENDLGMAYRTDNASTSWTDLVPSLDTGLNTLTKTAQPRREFILASTTTDNPLPVQLAVFTAAAGNGKVKLAWVTQSEIENQGFIILRSLSKESGYEEIASYETDMQLRGAGTISRQTNYEFTDADVQNGVMYWYKLVDVTINGYRHEHGPVAAQPSTMPGDILMVSGNTPQNMALYQNYPNPFNPETKINFDIPENVSGNISLEVFNILGQKVATLFEGSLPAGKFAAIWDGKNSKNQNVPSGMYFYSLRSWNFSAFQKMILAR